MPPFRSEGRYAGRSVPIRSEAATERQDPSPAMPAPRTVAPFSGLRAAGFAAVFLVLTLSLLIGYRYTAGTRLMDAYLFLIARHTAAVLSLVGHSGSVEDPSAFEGRAEEIRARVRAWGGTETGQSGPLTPWEVWRYRALKSRRDAAQERQRLQALDAPADPPDLQRDATELGKLRARLGRLEQALRGTPAGPIQSTAALQKLQAALSSPGLTPDRLANVEAELDRLEAQARAHLQARVLKLEAAARDEGPRVVFVARPDRDFVFRVVPDCGAVPSLAIFLAAVVAFPAPWRKRLYGLALGIPFLYAVNVLRLACLGVFGAWAGAGKWLHFAHHYVWQGIYVVFVVAAWLLWVEVLVRGRRSWPKQAP
jgi:exosortase/archaeosortase family protein